MATTADKERTVALKGHIEGLDGLRGLALIMVVIAHLYLLNIGWIGMQSFFVLSGFLITRVLLVDRERAPSFGSYLKRFYLRRLWRILPIYYGYLLIMVAVTEATEPQRDQLFYSFTYLYNFFTLRVDREHSFTFDHLWSMSVEEQFYLIWPFVMYWFNATTLRRLLIGMVLMGGVLRALTWATWPPDVLNGVQTWRPLTLYVVTWSYLDAFAIGALLNFVSVKPRPVHLVVYIAVMLAIGMAINGIGIGPAFKDGPYLSLGWPLYMARGYQAIWGYLIVNFFLFLLISLILHNQSIRRFFSNSVFDWLGRRSYPTYVLHYPILSLFLPLLPDLIEITGHRISGTILFGLIYVPFTLVIADFAHRYIEIWGIERGRRHTTASKSEAPRA